MTGTLFTGENDDIQIKGGTDGTLIGNIGDRLKIAAATSPAPASNVVYAVQKLTNGGSEHMAVNGAVTPVNFDYTPASSETWFITAINVFLFDNGTTVPTSFGAIAGGLLNGVEIRVRSKGTEYLMGTIQNNIQMSLFFRDAYFVPGTSGLFESSDIVVAKIQFENPIIIQNSTSDFVRFRIRDNLSSLDEFSAQAKVWKSI